MSRSPGVRISSGSLRGRTLAVPVGTTVRPMRSRVREALFNHLGDRVRGARFLDVFAGSGAIGVEALSRGAGEAVLVENGATVLPVLHKNLQNLSLGSRCRVLAVDIHREGLRALDREAPFDLIFLDPPFGDFRDSDGGRRDPFALLEDLVSSPLLRAGGIIGYERPSDLPGPDAPPTSEVEFQRAYGDTTLELWLKG